MTDKKQEPEAQILDDGILVPLGKSEYWVKFVKSWGNTDATKYRNASDIDSLRFLVSKVVDWSLPDSDWKPLPFDKEKLTAQLDAFSAYNKKVEQWRVEKEYVKITQEPMPECFSIPTQLQIALSNAFYEALGASYKVPFGK